MGSFWLHFDLATLLVALTVYILTGGADYGTGMWDLMTGGPRAGKQSEIIEQAIAPIWEADHVWLILVVVILFTAFPAVFSRIMITLNIPLTVMIIGVVMRGAAFSFRNYGTPTGSAHKRWGRIFAMASVVTPILIGIAVGAIASGRLPEHPRALSDFVTPWLAPFPLAVGVLTLVLFAYLAATYLTLETDDPELAGDFRLRALCAGLAAGLMTLLVLILAKDGAPRVWSGLTQSARTWPLIWIAAIFAIGALYALWSRRYPAARFCAAGQATMILWAWALAQFPNLVEPDLTIYNSAAPAITLEFMGGAIIVGSAILLPSFSYLMRVFKSHPHRHRRFAILRELTGNKPESPE